MQLALEDFGVYADVADPFPVPVPADFPFASAVDSPVRIPVRIPVPIPNPVPVTANSLEPGAIGEPIPIVVSPVSVSNC